LIVRFVRLRPMLQVSRDCDGPDAAAKGAIGWVRSRRDLRLLWQHSVRRLRPDRSGFSHPEPTARCCCIASHRGMSPADRSSNTNTLHKVRSRNSLRLDNNRANPIRRPTTSRRRREPRQRRDGSQGDEIGQTGRHEIRRRGMLETPRGIHHRRTRRGIRHRGSHHRGIRRCGRDPAEVKRW